MMRSSTLIVAILVGANTGCNRQDKECVTRICMKTAIHAETALGEFRKNFGDNWFAGAGIEARVAARLRWDKQLDKAEITVGMCDEMVELSGSVKTAEQKKRAYELALSTAGVKEVADLMQISP